MRRIVLWRFFWTFLWSMSGEGCAPATPALPPPATVGSQVFESCRERRDLEGNVDWEKGVIGDAKPADVLAPPALLFAEKDVVS